MTNPTYFPRAQFRAAGAARGAAMVEAVVVLPVLIILFVSVFYVRNQVLASQAAASEARTCAWAYSMNNCSTVPPGCDAQIVGAARSIDARVEEDLSKARSGVAGPVVDRVLKPVLDAAFGQALDANSYITYNRPSLYGGGTRDARGSYHLACNLAPQTLTDVAKDAWNALSSKF